MIWSWSEMGGTQNIPKPLPWRFRSQVWTQNLCWLWTFPSHIDYQIGLVVGFANQIAPYKWWMDWPSLTKLRATAPASPSAAMLRSDVSESAAPFRDQQTASAQWDCWNPSSLMQRIVGQSIWKANPIRLEVYNELAFRCIQNHHSCQKYAWHAYKYIYII